MVPWHSRLVAFLVRRVCWAVRRPKVQRPRRPRPYVVLRAAPAVRRGLRPWNAWTDVVISWRWPTNGDPIWERPRVSQHETAEAIHGRDSQVKEMKCMRNGRFWCRWFKEHDTHPKFIRVWFPVPLSPCFQLAVVSNALGHTADWPKKKSVACCFFLKDWQKLTPRIAPDLGSLCIYPRRVTQPSTLWGVAMFGLGPSQRPLLLRVCIEQLPRADKWTLMNFLVKNQKSAWDTLLLNRLQFMWCMDLSLVDIHPVVWETTWAGAGWYSASAFEHSRRGSKLQWKI